MSLINIFFLLPSKGEFLKEFAHNDQLKSQAERVWKQLDGLSTWLLLLAAGLGIGLAIYYYTAYNEMPGRHYKIKHWVIWGVIATVLSFVGTVVIEYACIKTNLKNGIGSLYWMCALNNAFYCIIVYFLTSLVWCKFCRTNAWKLIK